MTGTFLLTFDSEGKWGIADSLKPEHRELYTSRHLQETYGTVLALLQKYGISATFAVTAAFSMSRNEFARLRPRLEDYGVAAGPWMKRALMEIETDAGDGWFVPSCFHAINDAGAHEIGCHSFSHIPWRAPYATRTILDAELALVRQVSGFSRDSVRSFVYPRNQIAHQDLLPVHGFHVFRGARRSLGRAANLMREFNVLSPSEQLGSSDSWPLEAPAGHYLNWRNGLRRVVPTPVTIFRWQHMLRHAAQHGGVVHAWTHPEDFVGRPSMFTQLDRLLRLVAEAREAGRLRVVTCRDLAEPTPSPGGPVERPTAPQNARPVA